MYKKILIITISLLSFPYQLKANPSKINPLSENWVVIGEPGVIVQYNRASLRREGNKVFSDFAYFYPKYDYERNQLTNDYSLAILGKRIDYCVDGNFTIDKTEYPLLLAFNEYKDGERIALQEVNDEFLQEYYADRPFHSVLLHRHLCDNVQPRYLRAGMSFLEAKRLLYANKFKIETFEPGLYEEGSQEKFCDDKRPCISCSQGFSRCYVAFKNSDGKVYTLTIDPSFTTVIDSQPYNEDFEGY
ncbi:hypothetical protein [Synechocystis sp. FACHB-383]|uniref:hypothetical protein n=1 Tax=Synechocystis sp. FACHB-383 TaxID=2692864 RepID=UPI001A7E91C1|nr:hypothetical protein [Synechocystis sp. FACHB-383]